MADLTIPARDGQTVGGFVSEVQEAIVARLESMIPAELRGIASASCDIETIGDGDAVGEVEGMGEDRYFRFRYSRDDRFNLVLSEPEAVVEVTTYEPAEQPPVGLARAVLCDMAPVHAPAAEGLTRGRPVQLLRVGPLHDLDSGAHVLDVTDELCAGIAATAAASGYSIPIDHGHSLYRAQSAGEGHASVALYGRIVALEARPGDGLYGVPEWTEAGQAMLAASPGLLYLSPTILGQAHDPATGAALPGRALHSVSLTPTPRQDRLDTLALSRGDTPGAVAPSQKGPTMDKDVVQLSRTDHAALLARVAEFETNAQKAEADKKAAEAKLAQAEGDAMTLSARLTALEAERAIDKANAELDAAENEGKVIPPDARDALLALAPKARALTLSLMSATRPAAKVSHGATVPEPRDESDPAVVVAAVGLARSKGIDFQSALKLAANPAGVQ